MTDMPKPKPVPAELSNKLLDDLDRLIDRLVDRGGYCPHCVTRVLFFHAGLFAAHELDQDEMREALSYFAELNAKHCPSRGVAH
jgi:hypothetical protein